MRFLATSIVLLCSFTIARAQLSGNEKQWWIGFEVGGNTTFSSVSESYGVIVDLADPDAAGLDKEYTNPGSIAFSVGVMVGFEFIQNVSVSLHPSVHNYRFRYSTAYSWLDADGAGTNINYESDHRLGYFELPLIFRYDFDPGTGRSMSGNSGVRVYPFIQAGGVYATMISSLKNVRITGNEQSASGTLALNEQSVARDARELFIPSQFQLLGGAGLAIVLGNARFGLEINYRYGMNVITNRTNRYQDEVFTSGAYDVLDDISLRNLEAVMSFHMPLKFITSKDFKAF